MDNPELSAALSSADPAERASALSSIAGLGEYAFWCGMSAQVLPLLNDPVLSVRIGALKALGAMGATEQVEPLFGKLGAQDKSEKRAALEAIGCMGAAAAEGASYIESFLTNPDPELVADACVCLGCLKSSVSKLAEKLSSKDNEVAAAACTGLGKMDAEDAAVAKMITHQDPAVKVAAIKALTSMSQAASYAGTVAPLVGDSDCFVRLAASEMICSLGAKAAGQAAALGALVGSQEPGIAAAAATALGGIGAEASSQIPALEAALEVTGEDTSTFMMSASGVAPKALPPLRKPACGAAAALGLMGATKSADKVGACLSSNDWELRAEALSALGKMGKDGAKFESQVLAALTDSVPVVQSAALGALEGFAADGVAGEASATAAAGFLSSKFPFAKAAACSALGAMGTEAEPYVETLVKLFKDKSESVQAAAVKAVASCGDIGQMYAADACRLMFEGGPLTRAAAVEALSKMGDRGACFSEEIEGCLEDPAPAVRAAAETALAVFAGLDTEAIEAPILPPIGLSYVDPDKTKQPVCIMFPGQGSQYVKMLSDVQDLPKVKEMLAIAKGILGYDILSLCLKGPEAKLEATKFCQPAMYIGGLAGLELLKKTEPEKVASCTVMAGLSLGEYTALTAAGVIDFETGLKLVKLRGEAMQEAAESSAQMMASIAGLEKDVLDKLCKDAGGGSDICQVANFLFPKGFACAGSKKAVEKLVEKAEATEGCMQAKVLKTSGAFHTDFMKPARDKLLQALRGVQSTMKPPKCTVYMNVSGKPLPEGAAPADIVGMLGDQLCSCVLWEPIMKAMISSGIEEFYECGPQKQLKAMMKRIDPEMWKKTTNISV